MQLQPHPHRPTDRPPPPPARTHTHTHTTHRERETEGVRKLTPKILEVVSLTRSETNVSYDEMPFDAPVSSKTF
jgi:hypothetical protein